MASRPPTWSASRWEAHSPSSALALDFPECVLSLVLISTSLALPTDRALPGSSEALRRFVASAEADYSDAESVIEYLVHYTRVLAGGRRPFDAARARELVGRDVERARNFAAAQNHEVIPDDEHKRGPLSSITVPCLVIHGDADPMFPIEHGERLAQELPHTRLLALEGAGHGLDRADWATVARAIVAHTGIEAGGSEHARSAGPDERR
jgi:pimeloyl-ACP methyl ester carboxylesterase